MGKRKYLNYVKSTKFYNGDNMLKVPDGRGSAFKKMKARNMERVRELITRRPELTKGQLCEELGMAYGTLQRHLEELRLSGFFEK